MTLRPAHALAIAAVGLTSCSTAAGRFDPVREEQFRKACAEDMGYTAQDAVYFECVRILREFVAALPVREEMQREAELRQSHMRAACSKLELQPGTDAFIDCLRHLEDHYFWTTTNAGRTD